MKYEDRILNPYKLEQLRMAQIVVQTPKDRNSDEYQGLVHILKRAFPKDNSGISGLCPLYGAASRWRSTFVGIQVDYLSSKQILQVEDFFLPLPEEFKHGEEVEFMVKDCNGGTRWCDAKYLCPSAKYSERFIVETDFCGPRVVEHIRKKADVVKLTKEEIAKKLEIDVKNLEIVKS